MKSRATLLLFTSFMFIIIVVTTRFNYERMKMDNGFSSSRVGKLINQQEIEIGAEVVNPVIRPSTLENLPRGIVESTSDLELKELWNRKYVFQGSATKYNALLAVPVGLKQKNNVDIMVRKFLSANCSIILFHYDGNVDAWNDLVWSHKVVHVLAHNQTKWWFAKRFLHPDIVSIYDYIFLWDEDLGLEYFHPERYLQIVISEGLEISQPALDPDLSEVHHRITMRKRARKVHRRVYVSGGRKNCTDESTGPPCTGWVEGMAPVFSKAAWHCVWHLIQNDLIHGWGLDMKLGYCAQVFKHLKSSRQLSWFETGDRTEKVGIVDSEYIIHQGIQTLGGPSEKLLNVRSLDLRTQIRRQSSAELQEFRQRWDRAVREDEDWTDPFGT